MPGKLVRSSLVAMSGLMSLVTPACSNYEGRHLTQNEPLADPSAWDGDGIPYNLPAPEFTLQRSVVEGNATYAVNVNYVPHQEHRYTLRVDPSWLQSVGFDFDLSDRGQVTSVGMKQIDQIVPTVAAIGGFIASVSGVIALDSQVPAAPEDQSFRLTPTSGACMCSVYSLLISWTADSHLDSS